MGTRRLKTQIFLKEFKHFDKEKDIVKDIKQLRDELETKVEVYDPTEDIDDYEYFERLFPLVQEIFAIQLEEDGTARDIASRDYKLLISLVGYSAQPVVLGILAHKPLAIHLVGTAGSRQTHRQILNEVETYWQEMPEPTDDFGVEPSSSADAFSKIVLKWNELKKVGVKEPEKVAIDITGGKKTMVAGAFTAAAVYGFDIWYVDSGEYDPILQTPVPGTEKYIEVLNPMNIFSIKNQQDAITLFDRGQYQEAYESFQEAIDILRDPEYADIIKDTEIMQGVKKLHSWAQVYAHWDRMKYADALADIKDIGVSQDDIRYEALETLASLDNTRKGILENELKKQDYEKIGALEGEANTRTLEKLYRDATNDNDRFPVFFALDLYLSAIRFKKRKRYDDALLRMNRAIEIWGQYCLYQDGFNPLRTKNNKPRSLSMSELMCEMKASGRISEEQFNLINELIAVRNNLSIIHSIGNCNKFALADLKEEANKILDDFSKNYLCVRKNKNPKEEDITFTNLIERLTFKKAEEILNEKTSSKTGGF